MTYLPNLLFLLLLICSISLFIRNINKVITNINLGKQINRSDNSGERWKNMILLALGQSKMVSRPVSGILHILVYLGFILINIELLEIIIDGILGTHRIFSPFLGEFYSLLIGVFEIFAFLVIVAVTIFWIRRNIIRIKRFMNPEMKGWPKRDADYILYFEIILMFLFLSMNSTDSLLQNLDVPNYQKAGWFPISSFLDILYANFSIPDLILLERTFWWMHIIGILFFLNYLYYSKHLHILLAFPNTYYANLELQGKFKNNSSVTSEVKLMLDSSNNSFDSSNNNESIPDKFGASDVTDLTWVQLLNAYSCTECGRCTSECPANLTGKKLSPRKIMMDTRDRLVEVGDNFNRNNSKIIPDGKQLLKDYISPEELWACTSCNACVEACPIGIDPLSIIMDMRQYLVMEKSAAPSELNNMMGNIENNGAPWPFNNQDRLLWAEEN
ncbi:MAG: Fe-S oxidoreductase [Flavobacteriaceae bacterium]|nr:Fe-S oxidoreductase [Flavobacteriaceae bacterium]|tara:strand:- start:890 stop:2218 length:1329 start_codon:yes stop_codon:yes gene_type:complete